MQVKRGLFALQSFCLTNEYSIVTWCISVLSVEHKTSYLGNGEKQGNGEKIKSRSFAGDLKILDFFFFLSFLFFFLWAIPALKYFCTTSLEAFTLAPRKEIFLHGCTSHGISLPGVLHAQRCWQEVLSYPAVIIVAVIYLCWIEIACELRPPAALREYLISTSRKSLQPVDTDKVAHLRYLALNLYFERRSSCLPQRDRPLGAADTLKNISRVKSPQRMSPL